MVLRRRGPRRQLQAIPIMPLQYSEKRYNVVHDIPNIWDLNRMLFLPYLLLHSMIESSLKSFWLGMSTAEEPYSQSIAE